MRERGFRPAGPESSEKKGLREDLERLDLGFDIVEIEPMETPEGGEGKKVFRIDVKDKEAWGAQESAEKLLPYFGELAWQAYRPKGDKTVFNPDDPEMRQRAISDICDGDLSVADHVYVVADGEKIAGFLAFEDIDLGGDKKGCFINLTVVDSHHRGSGLGGELYRYVFSSREYDACLGCSNTPSAVKLRLNVGKQCGYSGFYCGFKDGQYGQLGTQEEQRSVRELSAKATEMFVDCGTTVPKEEIPENFIVVRQDVGPIPPIKQEDLKFGAHDAGLRETYENYLMPTQERLLPHTAYGILLNIKEK